MIQILKIDHLAPLKIGRADLHEQACKYVEEQFIRWGEVPPTWAIALGNMQVHWLVTPFVEEWDKDLAVDVVRAGMAMGKAYAYAFISEVWKATSASDDDPKSKIPPSDRPASERDDAVMVTSFDKDGSFAMTEYIVTMRPPGRGLSFLGPRIDIGDDTIRNWSGRMWNLLQQEQDNGRPEDRNGHRFNRGPD